MCSLPSMQLGKEVTSLYTVNKNKHGRRTFTTSHVGVQPVLNVSFDMENCHFLFFYRGGRSHTPALQSPLRYFLVAVTTCCETLILLVIRRTKIALSCCPGDVSICTRDFSSVWADTFSMTTLRPAFTLVWRWLMSNHYVARTPPQPEPGLFIKKLNFINLLRLMNTH